MAIQAARRIRSDDVMHTLTGLFTSNGVPENIRSVICDYSVKSTFPDEVKATNYIHLTTVTNLLVGARVLKTSIPSKSPPPSVSTSRVYWSVMEVSSSPVSATG